MLGMPIYIYFFNYSLEIIKIPFQRRTWYANRQILDFIKG